MLRYKTVRATAHEKAKGKEGVRDLFPERFMYGTGTLS